MTEQYLKCIMPAAVESIQIARGTEIIAVQASEELMRMVPDAPLRGPRGLSSEAAAGCMGRGRMSSSFTVESFTCSCLLIMLEIQTATRSVWPNCPDTHV